LVAGLAVPNVAIIIATLIFRGELQVALASGMGLTRLSGVIIPTM
jgi:hypothetical protein